MTGDAIDVDGRRRRTRVVSMVAIGAVLVGVFCTWATAGPVTLNGVEGPNNGWLVVIVALLALVWVRQLGRGSWIGVVGVFGSAVVMFGTALENALDNSAVLDASVGYGLLLVLVASLVLAATAVFVAVERLRSRRASVTV